MNEAEFSIQTPTDNVLEMDQAVLLYHGRSGSALATVHEVISVDGAPVIGAGRAMTAQAARELAGALLQRAAHGGFLPETVLYLQGDLLVWWVPPARRHLSFRVGTEQADAFGGRERGETRLGQRIGGGEVAEEADAVATRGLFAGEIAHVAEQAVALGHRRERHSDRGAECAREEHDHRRHYADDACQEP